MANARFLLETEGHDGTASDDEADFENGVGFEDAIADSQDDHQNSFNDNHVPGDTNNSLAVIAPDNQSETNDETLETPFVFSSIRCF